MSIAPLIDPLCSCSVLLVVGVTSSTTEVPEALESISAEPVTKRIAKAITGRLVLDLICIFVQCRTW
jgi:hypothetical protein